MTRHKFLAGLLAGTALLAAGCGGGNGSSEGNVTFREGLAPAPSPLRTATFNGSEYMTGRINVNIKSNLFSLDGMDDKVRETVIRYRLNPTVYRSVDYQSTTLPYDTRAEFRWYTILVPDGQSEPALVETLLRDPAFKHVNLAYLAYPGSHGGAND